MVGTHLKQRAFPARMKYLAAGALFFGSLCSAETLSQQVAQACMEHKPHAGVTYSNKSAQRSKAQHTRSCYADLQQLGLSVSAEIALKNGRLDYAAPTNTLIIVDDRNPKNPHLYADRGLRDTEVDLLNFSPKPSQDYLLMLERIVNFYK
jgi:hypothetical protein